MTDKDFTIEEPIEEYGQLDLNKTYTYWDYLKWKFTERVELIRGKVVKMSPAPNLNHQRIVGNNFGQFFTLLKLGPCNYFVAPFDVRLPVPSAGKETTVVQPDLCIVCDETKLDRQGCNGAPDLVVEILSPGNSKHELETKFNLYEESGVKEYWIIQPEGKTVLVYHLQNNKYIGLQPFCEGMTLHSPYFPLLKIEVSDLFIGVD
jgi:Uma2 family endonuclease